VRSFEPVLHTRLSAQTGLLVQGSQYLRAMAGVQLRPNASRILHRLGLADDLAAAGVKPPAWHQRRWNDGSTLLRAPLADLVEDAFGYRYYVIHRADCNQQRAARQTRSCSRRRVCRFPGSSQRSVKNP
jgi:2-polyprenyl-6-methoxyphenol hydroxylase-like FAD-dependent oxidoreductase